MAQQDPYQTIQTLISQYYAQPDSFSSDEVMQIKAAADELGVQFKIPEDFGRMAKNFLFNAADTATFGFMPDEIFGSQIKPDAMTSSDKMAGGLGSVAGFFTTPWALGGAAARGATKGLGALAARAPAAARGGAAINRGLMLPQVAGPGGHAVYAAPVAALGRGVKAGGATGLVGALERMGLGATGAAKLGGLAGRGLSKATGLAPGATGLASKGARLLNQYVSPKLLESGVRMGTASAASEFGNDLADGDFGAIVNRALGGAFLGGAGHMIGGAAQGVLPNVVKQLTGLSMKGGTQKAVRTLTAAIWGNMTAPEREMYPQEFIEQFLINSLMAYK